jgi:quercetin dioxygenase-like cupin family protein
MADSTPIQAPGMTITFLVEGEDSGDALSIFRCDFEAGARMPMPHSHDGFDETVYCLSGRFKMVVDGKARSIEPGEVIHVPRGTVHGFAVDEPSSILAISTPGIFGRRYFVEMGEAMMAAAGGPPDKALFAAIMTRHGLTPAVPVA